MLNKTKAGSNKRARKNASKCANNTPPFFTSSCSRIDDHKEAKATQGLSPGDVTSKREIRPPPSKGRAPILLLLLPPPPRPPPLLVAVPTPPRS